MKRIKRLHRDRDAIWFFCLDDTLFTLDSGDFPCGKLDGLGFEFDRQCPIYLLDYQRGLPCILVDLQHQIVDFPQGHWSGLRALIQQLPQALGLLAGRAVQVAHFIRTHQYCGQCGRRMFSIDWGSGSAV